MSSFRDIKRASRVLGIKSSSSGPWGEGRPDRKYKDGVCPACGNYDVELDKFNYCRDEECKRKRLVNALHIGEAIRTPDGTIIWTHGTIIRKDI